jgi:ribonuclease P protein 3
LFRYDNIRKSHPILDALTLENVIVALCLTKKWHLCEALLDEIRVTAVPTTFVTCALISAAFLNNADDLAWKLFREILGLYLKEKCLFIVLVDFVERDRLVYTNVYHSYFKKVAKCASKLETLGEIQKLFNFMHEHSLKLDDSAADEFVSSLRKLDVAVNTSVVNRSGVCKCCNGKLQSFDLTEEEFKDLQTYIIKNIIVGKDVFSKTTPEELLRFKHFVSNMDKYDVVIDGLNVGYSAGVKQTTMVFSALVASVVSHFVNRGKKVLVMGRNHMNKWPKKNWRYIQENAEIFLTQDLSQDDPYLLYCALHSGKDTIIITRDLMRNQKFLLKNVRQKLLFERWLAKGKYHLLRVQPSGIPIFREPLPFSSMPQKNGGYWHIPCFVNDKVPGPDTWLCIKL